MIVEDAEGSLLRMQVDTIDLYWLHRDDGNRPVSENTIDTAAINISRKNSILRLFQLAIRTNTRRTFARQQELPCFIANQPMATTDTAKLNDPTPVQMDEEMEGDHEKIIGPSFHNHHRLKAFFKSGLQARMRLMINVCLPDIEQKKLYGDLRELLS